MKKKILILGSAGMAGHVITLYLRGLKDQYQVIDVSRSENLIKPSLLVDVVNFDKLEELISSQRTDIIINCIGILNQYAENCPDQAVLLNSYLPHFLEVKTKNILCKVIHISTDCVFSGQKGKYTENELKDGKGFYAQSKALGEIMNDKDLTIRTSIIGPELKNSGIGLFNWFSEQNGTIKGYNQALWSGVTTIELAKAIVTFIEKDIKGIYHLTNNTSISKYDLLILLKNEFLNSGVTDIIPDESYKIDKSLLNTRTDLNYTIPTYSKMIKEMKIWIENHYDKYPHYIKIIS